MDFFKQILIWDVIESILCLQFSFEASIQIFDADLGFLMSYFPVK